MWVALFSSSIVTGQLTVRNLSASQARQNEFEPSAPSAWYPRVTVYRLLSLILSSRRLLLPAAF